METLIGFISARSTILRTIENHHELIRFDSMLKQYPDFKIGLVTIGACYI